MILIIFKFMSESHSRYVLRTDNQKEILVKPDNL